MCKQIFGINKLNCSDVLNAQEESSRKDGSWGFVSFTNNDLLGKVSAQSGRVGLACSLDALFAFMASKSAYDIWPLNFSLPKIPPMQDF
jgi:hypothetical protein